MFQAMVPFRSAVSLLTEYQNIERKAQIIWAVLQCHAKFDEFIAVGFKGHNVMVQQMALYMMTERVNPVQLDELKESGNDGRKALALVKSLSEAFQALKGEVGRLSQKHQSLYDDFTAFKRRGGGGGAGGGGGEGANRS